MRSRSSPPAARGCSTTSGLSRNSPRSNAKHRLSEGTVWIADPTGEDDCCNAAAGAMVLAISRQPMIVTDAALADTAEVV